MTLGCGAAGGNSTSDNVGPLHLINIKRLAYWVRRPEDAYTVPPAGAAQPVSADRQAIAAAVERYLAERGIRLEAAPSASVRPQVPAGATAEIVDRFLSAKQAPKSAPCPMVASCPTAPSCGCGAPEPPPKPAAEVRISDFVCENDVREAMAASRKIYIGPKTIVTPAARDLADRQDILVLAQR